MKLSYGMKQLGYIEQKIITLFYLYLSLAQSLLSVFIPFRSHGIIMRITWRLGGRVDDLLAGEKLNRFCWVNPLTDKTDRTISLYFS